jgi:hypothetical protein
VPPGPAGRYGVHCLPSGPGVTPLASPLVQTLGSTLKHRSAPAFQFKCSVWQPSVQFRSWRFFCIALAQVVAKPNTRPASNVALTSFGVRESCRWFAYRQDPNLFCWWPCMSPQSLGPRGRSCRHSIAKLPAKKVVVALSAWSLGVARAAWLSGRGRPSPGGGRLRFSYSRAMQARSEALPNPSVKRSANIASHWPSSAGAAPHFALAVQRATLLATAYLKR